MPEENLQHPVILFDGVCNLCSAAVQFVIKRDKKKIFRFASLQSSFGHSLLQKHQLPATDFNSFILFEDGKLYTKSTGALKVSRQLAAPWHLFYLFIIVPPFIRNSIYNVIAKNRYKWFGKKESCLMATPELKIRFFD